MSQTINRIIKGIKSVASDDLMSMGGIKYRLRQDFGKNAPRTPTILAWAKRTEQPKITNLASLLSPNGAIQTGIYFYPEVKKVVEQHYKKNLGRKKRYL